MHFMGIRVIINRIKAIRFMMADKSVPKRKKALIICGIIYLFLPMDLIPIMIFPVAWLDDVIVWALILWYLRNELDKYWTGGNPKDYSKKFRNKTVVGGVEFHVDEGKGDDSDAK